MRWRRRSVRWLLSGRQPKQPGAIAILEQIDLAARALLDFADAVAHFPLVGLARLVAADAYVDQRLARKRAEQGIALPLEEQVARVDDQPRRTYRRVPPDFGRFVAVAGAVVGNVDPVVIAAIRNVGPTIIAPR